MNIYFLMSPVKYLYISSIIFLQKNNIYITKETPVNLLYKRLYNFIYLCKLVLVCTNLLFLLLLALFVYYFSFMLILNKYLFNIIHLYRFL